MWQAETYARWLFDFLRTDLSALSPNQVQRVRADIWAFVRPEVIADASWATGQLPPIELVMQLRDDARKGIRRVREGHWFELEHGIGYGIAKFGDRIFRGSRRGTFPDLFRAAVMDTLQDFWGRLRECPRCHELFLKVGKQKYCGPVCSRRANWDAFQGRRNERDYRREYEKRVQKRLGPKAKVRIKRRRSK